MAPESAYTARDRSIRPIVSRLNGVIESAMTRFLPADTARNTGAISHISVPPRAVSSSLLVRSDVDLARCGDRLRALVSEGDCLAPWVHDGDIQFFELGRPAFDEAVVLLGASPHKNTRGRYRFTTKVLHRDGERWLLLSRDPPVVYDADRQHRFPVCGVMVAMRHYHEPCPRSAELQEMLEQAHAIAAVDGYDWSAEYLDEIFPGDVACRK